MPFHEYECPNGHITERFFKSLSEGEQVQKVECQQCITGACTGFYDQPVWAKKIVSRPLGFGFYGSPDGFHKPSALKRHSTKLAAASGNANAA
jgi:hypothetical protein